MNKIIDRPVLAIIFFTIVILLGFYSIKNTPIELVPEEDLPSLTVKYLWSGASPDTILDKVLLPAEEEIMQIKGISKLKSRATQGNGELEIEFNRNTRMDFANVILRERLNKLQKNLPVQVQKPSIETHVPDDFKKKPFFTIGVIGNYSIYNLKKIAEKEIEPYLKSIPGVESVKLRGGIEPEIKIQTNMDKLKKFKISLDYIYYKLRQNFYNIQSISMKKELKEITLALSENPKTIQDIQNIVITKLGKKEILLKEIAHVFFGYQELSNEMRFQGMPVIGFTIYKERNISSLAIAKRLRTKLQQLANKLKNRVEFVIQQDESKELKQNLTKLIKIASLILIIIFIILIIVVRDIKSSLLIFSSVFFSVFTTFTVIYILKIPLNILTLSGLALGFGLFVDNAVVVFDSILRHRERGFNLKDAAVKGARVVFLPVLSSTITTIIVFFSFTYFQGRLKVYYLPLSYVIAISLVSSIIVSFVLIPSLSARIEIKINKNRARIKTGSFFPFVLRYPLTVILPVILIFIFSYTHFKEEVSFGRFFSWYHKEMLSVGLYFPSGAEFKDIKDTILKFEKIALSKPYKKEIITNIYSDFRYANVSITFPEEIEFSPYPYQLKQELIALATNLAGIGVGVRGFDPEGYHYYPNIGSFLPYSIQIKGYNLEKLLDFTNKIKKSLLNHRRIKEVDINTDTRMTWGAKEKYYSFKPDMEKLKIYKISQQYLSNLISSVLRERSGFQKIKFNDKEIFVEIKSSDVKKLELDDILNMNFETSEGIPFRIKDVVDIGFTIQKGGIGRENQEYIASINWDYLGSSKSGDKYHKTLYNNLKVPPGFKKSLEQRRFLMSEEEESQLNFAIILSLFLIYLILGILYENFLQPLLIMLSIPLALIGVFWAFIIMDYNFDSSAYIGVILLSGIVVNNAIILIDNINRHLKNSTDIIKSIITGTKERIRPIFMTTSTTVFGMIPLILFQKPGKTDIWSSLALCTIGGLTTSALLILFILPIFYYLFYKLQKFIIKQKPISKT